MRIVGDDMVADLNASPCRRFKTGEQTEGRRLSTAAGTEQGEKFARSHPQRDIVDGRQLPVKMLG